MSTFTEHYSLIMPSQEDYYDVQDFNENTEALDGLLFEQETAIANVGEKVDGISNKLGNPDDPEENTLFGILKNWSPWEPYYLPDQTSVQYEVKDQQLGNMDSDMMFVLYHFTAEHDGTIYAAFTYQYSVTSNTFLGTKVYTEVKPGTETMTLPIGSWAYHSSFDPYPENTINFPSVDDTTPPVGTYSSYAYIYVEKGKSYIFATRISYCTNLVLKDFQICYKESGNTPRA